MKAIDFVNSKDIREYWEDIGYKPAALESAWLIWQSKNHTVAEKHEAFEKIIKTTEDYTLNKYELNVQKLYHSIYTKEEKKLAGVDNES